MAWLTMAGKLRPATEVEVALVVDVVLDERVAVVEAAVVVVALVVVVAAVVEVVVAGAVVAGALVAGADVEVVPAEAFGEC